MSLGATGCSDGSDALSKAVDNAVDQGVLMVIAAGNSGPGACTVGTPGAARKALTVGASIDPGKNGWALAYFSSRGPTADNRVKPDVVAPGWDIVAAKAGSTDYIAHSGTSMATPQVAGIAALVLSANPRLSPTAVKDLLMGTATHWGPAGRNNEYGAGLVQPYAAIAKVRGAANSFSDGTAHNFYSGSLGWFGRDSYDLEVGSTDRPIGLTLIQKSWIWPGFPKFVLSLSDPSGNEVAVSRAWQRQQTITFTPKTTGTYTVAVGSSFGSGDYWLDTSSH